MISYDVLLRSNMFTFQSKKTLQVLRKTKSLQKKAVKWQR